MQRTLPALILALMLLASCGADSAVDPGSEQSPAGPSPGVDLAAGVAAQSQATDEAAWPPALPKGGVQPWESLDSAGFIQPGSARGVSVINSSGEFAAGVERFQDAALGAGIGVSELGEALRLNSGPAGSGGRTFATYRLLLGSAALGALSVDVNPAGGSSSRYFIGLANYGTSRWDWFGSFDENNVRLAGSLLRSGDYTTDLGELYIIVMAYDGAAVDVVGVAANPDNTADTTPPPAPAGLTLTPVSGGVEAAWNQVLAPDLAGYRAYYSNSTFSSPADPGVKSLPSLTSLTRALVSRPSSGPIFVAIRAVDTSGNQSALGSVQSATISVAAAAPALQVTASVASVLRDGAITLSSNGNYSSFQLDMDGDGVYELSNGDGSAVIDTSGAGLIRANVRASEGDMVAYGGISVIILANSRPACSAVSSNYSPELFEQFTLTGTAQDAEDTDDELTYDWDLDADGIFETPNENPVGDIFFAVAGYQSTKLRVTDTQGAWDVDTIGINVQAPTLLPPTVSIVLAPSSDVEVGDTVQIAAAAVDYDGQVTDIAFDIEGTPLDFETPADENGNAFYTPVAGGDLVIGVRVSDDDGHLAYDFGNLHVKGMSNFLTPFTNTGNGSFCSLADVGGRMAATYYDSNTDSLMYIRAKNSAGTQFEAPFTIQDLLGGTAFNSLAMVSGRPAIAYQAAGGSQLHYRRAGDSTGSSWGAPVTIASGSDVGAWCDLTMINGRPAVAYDNSTDATLHYRRSSDTTGTAWATDDTVDNCSPFGSLVNLIENQGAPTLAYRYSDNHLVYILGSSADDIGTGFIDLTGNVSGVNPRISLKLVGGRPAIAYEDSAVLRYVRAISESGVDGWGSVRNLGTPGALCALEIFNGVPLIAYFDSNDDELKFQQANEADAYGFSPWSYTLTLGDASTPTEPQSIRMEQVNGRLAVLAYIPVADTMAFGNFVP